MTSRVRLTVFAATAAVIGVNAIAYMQARAMSHFVAGGARTERPEHLSALDAAAVIFTGVRIPRPTNDLTPGDVDLPFETVRFASLHGPTLEAWRVAGDAEDTPLVIAFHGYAASKSALLPSTRILHDLSYEVLLVDFYGSGGSSGTGTSLGLLEGRDVAASVAYVGRPRRNAR